MKKFFLFLLIVAGLALFNSCDEPELEPTEIEKEKVVIPTNGISATVIEKEKVIIPSNG